MLSVIIPTRNAAPTLVATLAALVPAVVDGIVREVIIVDGKSTDETRAIADAAGARFLETAPGRGRQLAAGASAARHEWLLFIHADTVLEAGWQDEVASFVDGIGEGRRDDVAASFGFALDDTGLRPRMLETVVNLRSRIMSLPYGDQGLLLSRPLYEEIGGFKPMPLFEDVDIIRRIGRRRLLILRTRAITSAVRYRSGYVARVARNLRCLLLYYAGVSPERLEKIYNA